MGSDRKRGYSHAHLSEAERRVELAVQSFGSMVTLRNVAELAVKKKRQTQNLKKFLRGLVLVCNTCTYTRIQGKETKERS